MKIIRSSQNTLVDSSVDTEQFILNGANNAEHAGFIIGAKQLARGDYFRLRSMIRITPGDNPSAKLTIKQYFDDVLIYSSTAQDINTGSPMADFGMCNFFIGNDGLLYTNATTGAITTPPDSGAILIMNVSFADASGHNTFNKWDLLQVRTGQVPQGSLGYAVGDTVFDLTVPHQFKISATFDTASTNSTVQLIGAEIQIEQPNAGNTAGQ